MLEVRHPFTLNYKDGSHQAALIKEPIHHCPHPPYLSPKSLFRVNAGVVLCLLDVFSYIPSKLFSKLHSRSEHRLRGTQKIFYFGQWCLDDSKLNVWDLK